MEFQAPDSSIDFPPGADNSYGYPSEWEIFTLAPADVSRESTVVLNFSPMAPLRPGCPIEFNIMPNSLMYVDLKNIQLYLQVKLTNLDGTDIADGEQVALINYPIASLFRQVDFYIQQQIICSSSTAYPYRSMLDVLLESDTSDIQGPLRMGLFVPDSSGNMDTASNRNSGFSIRQGFSNKSRVFELLGKLHIDLFRQNRLLVSGVQLTIKMSQTSEEFRIIRPAPEADAAGKQYRVEIVKATLKVPMAKPTPAMFFGHQRGMMKNPAVFPFERTEIKTMAIPSGMSQWPLENLFLSAQPKRLLVALVSSAAFNGDYTKNPFNFQHFNLNYLCLTVDGSCVPSQALQPDYENDFFVEAYDTLFSIAPDERIGRTRKITTIMREHYKNGYCMYMFNLDGGSQGSPYVNPQSIGLSKLDIRFAEKLTEPVTVILYATYNAVLEVDRNRSIRVRG